MSRKILIDLAKFRETAVDGKYNYGECTYDFHPDNIGMKDIVEQAMMRLTCRRCEEAPGMMFAYVEAWKKRTTLAQVRFIFGRSASHVLVCPLEHQRIIKSLKSISYLCDFNYDYIQNMKTAPEGAIVFTEIEPNEEEHIYSLNDRVLIKEFVWDDLKKNE